MVLTRLHDTTAFVHGKLRMTFSRRYFEFMNIILGSKTIKIQLSFPFLSLSYHASIRTTPLPFENSDSHWGIHTVKVTLLTVPAKSSARHIIFPTLAWFSFHTRNLKGNQFFLCQKRLQNRRLDILILFIWVLSKISVKHSSAYNENSNKICKI